MLLVFSIVRNVSVLFHFVFIIYLLIIDSKSVSIFFNTENNYQLILVICVMGLGEWQYVANSRLHNKKIMYLWIWDMIFPFHLNLVVFDVLELKHTSSTLGRPDSGVAGSCAIFELTFCCPLPPHRASHLIQLLSVEIGCFLSNFLLELR